MTSTGLFSVDHPILFLLLAKFGWVIPVALGSLAVKPWRRMRGRPNSDQSAAK